MVQGTQFRRILPILQTVLAAVFGGSGIWLRNSILSRPFWGDATWWDSTAAFHVWPWPFKFAAILNMPAFLAGLLLSWPIDALRPGLPEWVSLSPTLFLVPLLWYRIGSWLDHRSSGEMNRASGTRRWALLAIFIFICGAASSIPSRIGGNMSYIPLGIVIWVAVAIPMKTSSASRKHETRAA
jgi:hypothetical protein